MNPIQHLRRASRRGILGVPARPGRVILAALAAAILTFGGALSASAQEIPHLGSQVTDQTGVLGGTGSIQPALDDLQNNHGVQLWVAFIPTTGGPSAPDFARSTYEQNGLGGNDVLLLVAVNDHRYGWRAADSGPLAGIRNDVDGILSDSVDSRFRAGDFAGGVTAFANALGNRLAAGSATTRPVTAQPGGTTETPSSQQSADPLIGLIVAIILILAGLAIVGAWWSRRRADRLAAREREQRIAQRSHDANQLLINTDDAVREAQQEVGFVEAQFGEDDANAYRTALGTATAELKSAFAVRQKLDDAEPEDPPTREAMVNEVLGRAQRAAAILDEQHKHIQSLRESEAKAPEVLAALPAAIDALAARLPSAQQAFAKLRGYAPQAWASVSGNGTEAEKRIAAARAEVETGQAALATDVHTAARSARVAQAAVAQANGLLDAIEKLVASLDETRQRLSSEIAAAAPDVERARAAVSAGKVDASARPNVDEAERLLGQARSQAGAAQPDVIAGYQAAQKANQLADGVLEGVRQAEERQARAVAALAAALQSASVSVDRATDYITSRRHGVGREARTRLAEAERHLEMANQLQSTDATRAFTEAQAARQFADEAYQLASNDFDDWDVRGGGRRGGDPTGALLGGIILGGILGGMGGRGRGGWGGTPWGGGFGGGGGGGFGGGGSFGGGGGGSFGGGGGW